MTPENLATQFGDTTYTKVFVGGLAWETQKDTMKKYFEQFGEILEAVVISDKATGRSKGYGFVTFREPESAMRACMDASPVIDGRRANCNLASFGVQRSKPSTPKHGNGGRNMRIMSGFQTGFGGVSGTTFPSTTTFPHYAIQQGIPTYNVYGYSQYSPDYSYPTSYYNVYGGATAQYPIYGSGNGVLMTSSTGGGGGYYPYVQFSDGNGGSNGYSSAQSYGVQYPHHHLFHYSTLSSTAAAAYAQHYASPMSLPPTSALQSVCFAMPQALHAAPIPHR